MVTEGCSLMKIVIEHINLAFVLSICDACSPLNRPLSLYTFPENEPSVYDLQSSGGAPPVGGFIYRGCQSRRLYGSYVFGDRNG